MSHCRQPNVVDDCNDDDDFDDDDLLLTSSDQRVFQSSEVFLFPDDCAQSSLVPVWQSSLPFCQVI